jgi:hypothetical protein
MTGARRELSPSARLRNAPIFTFGLTRATEHSDMLWTIFVILLILWLLGLVTSYTFGGFVHILLVLAVVVLVIRLLQGRRVL